MTPRSTHPGPAPGARLVELDLEAAGRQLVDQAFVTRGDFADDGNFAAEGALHLPLDTALRLGRGGDADQPGRPRDRRPPRCGKKISIATGIPSRFAKTNHGRHQAMLKPSVQPNDAARRRKVVFVREATLNVACPAPARISWTRTEAGQQQIRRVSGDQFK